MEQIEVYKSRESQNYINYFSKIREEVKSPTKKKSLI